MENLDTRVKDLADENENLKKENGRLLTRVHTLEMEVNMMTMKFLQISSLFE